MAVKDGGLMVSDAITSILNQTYTNFEFLIINDGSKDDTLETLSHFNDPRIKVFTQENQGLARALNRGLRLAKGEFIARQDHDDISLPQRLSKQLDFLLKNNSFGLVGSAAEIWQENKFSGRIHDHPTKPGLLKFELIFNNPFVHSSLMFRSSLLMDIGFYTEDRGREPPEDYEYISRIARKYDVGNLSERLVIYREIPNSLSSQIRPNHKDAGISNFLTNLARISDENFSYGSESENLNLGFGQIVHFPIQNISHPIEIDRIKKNLQDIARRIYLHYGEKKVLSSCRVWCLVLSLKVERYRLYNLENYKFLQKIILILKIKTINQLIKIQNRFYS